MNYIKIHFLNVGHGDCTIIEFPHRLTVVDINRCKTFASDTDAELRRKYGSKYSRGLYSLAAGPLAGAPNSLWRAIESGRQQREIQAAIAKDRERLTDPIEYLKSNFRDKEIFRYIQTHPDMDHMAGLYQLVWKEGFSITNFWDTRHCIEKDESAKKWQNVNFDINDWHAYQHIRKGNLRGTKVLTLDATSTGNYYTDDGITIWAPFNLDKVNDPDADPNCFSYVLHIQYGKCSIVLGGDLPEERWAELYKRVGGNFPKVNLLKPSHHGRKSGYHRDSVKAMNPDVSVVSVGELKAKDDASASYERFSSAGCFSTVEHGDIVAMCWEDGDVWLDACGKRIKGPAPLRSLAALSSLGGSLGSNR